jgi:hypothetical protein
LHSCPTPGHHLLASAAKSELSSGVDRTADAFEVTGKLCMLGHTVAVADKQITVEVAQRSVLPSHGRRVALQATIFSFHHLQID